MSSRVKRVPGLSWMKDKVGLVTSRRAQHERVGASKRRRFEGNAKGQAMYVMSKITLMILLVGLLSITMYTYTFFQQASLRSYGNALVTRITNVSQAVVQASSTSDTQVFDLPFTIGSTANQVAYLLRIQRAADTDDPNGKASFAVVCMYTLAEASKEEEAGQAGGAATACSAFKVDGDVKVFNIKGTQEGLKPIANSPGDFILDVKPLDKKMNLLVVRKITKCSGGLCEPRVCIMECSALIGDGARECRRTLNDITDCSQSS
ncbi:MAG: hypothetical protein GOV15_03070 [Candidatus Diapherotrites archaeon]|nr:hypothetical protein [Candidatus Diapherotrites archaeon]